MKRMLTGAQLVLSVGVCELVLLQGQTAQVTQVSVLVAVDGAKGPVYDLQEDDFEVLVGGEPFDVHEFAVEHAPLNVVMLIDVSASMLPWERTSLGRTRLSGSPAGSGISPDQIRRGVDRLGNARSPDDRIRVGTFGAHIAIGAPVGPDRAAFAKAGRAAASPDRMERFGPSPIWDAVAAAVEVLEPESGHRSVLLVTDGRATGNRLGLAQVAERASLAGVTVSIIAPLAVSELPHTDKTIVVVDPSVFLGRLADLTGGLYQRHDHPTDRNLAPLVDRAIADLRRRYRITLKPPSGHGSSQVEVRVRVPGLTVRGRKIVALN